MTLRVSNYGENEMTNVPVLTVGPNNGVRLYTSIRTAARALSGNGTARARSTISRRVAVGGGYVGSVWVTNGASFVRPV